MKVQQLLGKHLPGYAVDSVTLLGEGWDNIAYEVNGELIVRFSKDDEPAQAVSREAAVLSVVRQWSALAVPLLLFSDPGAGALAYPKLEGLPLNECQGIDGHAVGRVLGEFHRGLHGAPLADVTGVDDRPLPELLAEAAQDYRLVADLVPQRFRPAIARFLQAQPPPRGTELVFCHNDLGAEHILANDAGEPLAVIDWTDAAMADPARDPGLVLRDLGPEVFEAMNPGDWAQRSWFYARCSVLADIVYGVRERQPHYRDEGLASLAHLFLEQAG